MPPYLPGTSLLIGRGDEILIHKGYGLSDLENYISADPESSYLITSVTKQFACAAVMILAEEGQLDIDSPIGLYSPRLPSYREQVTLRHLMTHTSGISEYFNQEFRRSYCQEGSPSLSQTDFVDYICNKYPNLEFEPGSAWSYSNSAYVILGEIIEHISQAPFSFRHYQIFLILFPENKIPADMSQSCQYKHGSTKQPEVPNCRQNANQAVKSNHSSFKNNQMQGQSSQSYSQKQTGQDNLQSNYPVRTSAVSFFPIDHPG
ncbi:beta-lactamase family protein [bacterium]|nr:beta-lactamase family protein [bacterium]